MCCDKWEREGVSFVAGETECVSRVPRKRRDIRVAMEVCKKVWRETKGDRRRAKEEEGRRCIFT